jgi:hypothetical protein
MKEFYYIDEQNEEKLDLVALFEHALDYKVDCYDIQIALNYLQGKITIQEKK